MWLMNLCLWGLLFLGADFFSSILGWWLWLIVLGALAHYHPLMNQGDITLTWESDQLEEN